MSLKKCKDCGATVSGDATACPSCGKPQRGWFGCGKSLLVIAIVIGLFVVFAVIVNNSANTPPAPSALHSPDEVAKTLGAAVNEVQKKTQDPVWQKSKAGKLYKKHPDWPPAECDAIAAGKVSMGMTADQVRAAWGKPEHINTTVTAGGKHEQWVWGSSQYAYFQDGILTSVQQNGQ